MDAKKRQVNWTEKEKCVLVEEERTRDDILFGKLKGCGFGGVSTAEKENAWKEVAVAVNAVSNTSMTKDQMKKQHSNKKQRYLVVIPPTHADTDCSCVQVPECSYNNESINKKDSEKNGKRSLKRKFNDIGKENILLDNEKLRMSIKKLTKEEDYSI